ncbi:C-factor isoform X1 [Tyto alba]|uniref:C-factor isoform X1 n=1 Tax=Tyto alba TaxID=56313 RepID=UPI001C685096|nr:C-factor isoform X1 [Tyto alba]
MCWFPSSEVGDSVTNSAVSVPLSDTELSLKCFCTLPLSGFGFVFFFLCYMPRGLLLGRPAGQSLEQCSSKELQQLSKQYSNIKLLQLDVVCENSIKKVVKEVEEIVGDKGLNCLINNAGINVLASLEEVTAETMLTIYETNTVAQLMVTKAFLPLLRKAAQLSTGMGCHRAAIINMSSLAASMQLVQANEMFLKVYPYRIAKTALNMITRCLAADLKSDGILCISLHPGWLQTDMGGNMAPMQVQEAIPGILSVLDRLGEKENGSFLDWQGETLPW